jgi:MraZ protein
VSWVLVLKQRPLVAMVEDVSKMLFQGKFTHKLDPKNRVAIPAEWRMDGEFTVYLLQSERDGLEMIKVLLPSVFEDSIKAINEDPELNASQRNSFISVLCYESYKTQVNSQGKLLLPKEFCKLVNKDGSVQFVGRGRHFEIWHPDLFVQAREAEMAKVKALNKTRDIF